MARPRAPASQPQCLLPPMPDPNYLTPEEVIARYRGQVSEGTLRNWRCMRIGPSFLKIGKPLSERRVGSLGQIDPRRLQTHTRTAAGKGGTARVAERPFGRSEVAG